MKHSLAVITPQELAIQTRKETLNQVQKEILVKQEIIESCMHKLHDMRNDARELIATASDAMNERDALFMRIENEHLWEDDYATLEEYYDNIGLTRQRMHQIMDRIRVIKLVNSVDDTLPPPSDIHARKLRQLDTDEAIITVYKQAVLNSGGASPSPASIDILVDAVQSGINPSDNHAMSKYEDLRISDRIYSFFIKMTAAGQQKLIHKLIDVTAPNK